MDGRGSAARFSERYPLLITETCGHTHFYDEFWRKTTHFLLFFANFWITHPCLRKICRKRGPCLENLGPKNPPIWAAHTRTLNMLCTPPRAFSRICFTRGLLRKSSNYSIYTSFFKPPFQKPNHDAKNYLFSPLCLSCLFYILC